MIPTRWRTLFDEQLTDADRRVQDAQRHLQDGEGERAMHGAYQAVVTAAGIRVWMVDHPWVTPLAAEDMQRRITHEFPGQFSALATLDMQAVLTGSWAPDAARTYVEEADGFVRETRERLEAWVSED